MYNAQVKQKQGLCGITLAPKAQTKWLYTKSIVAEVAGKMKVMLGLESTSDDVLHHHESGPSQVQKDILAVQRTIQVVATKMVNPFQVSAGEGLICISTGAKASTEAPKDLTHVKKIGEKALKECLEGGGEKLSVIRINTFETKQSKKSTGKEKQKARPEINLQRLSQVICAGGEVSLNELVGEHECTDISLLFI